MERHKAILSKLKVDEFHLITPDEKEGIHSLHCKASGVANRVRKKTGFRFTTERTRDGIRVYRIA